MSKAAGFLERNVAALSDTLDHAARADETARRRGLLQLLDPRTKIIGLFAWILVAAGTRRLAAVGVIFTLILLLAALSQVPWRTGILRVWMGVLIFTGPLALPAIFLTPGPPAGWHTTAPGWLAAARLVARAETTATVAALFVLTTPWARGLQALRVLRVPRVVVAILGMTHRYIYLLLGLARDYFEARRSRLVGRLAPAARRQLAAGTAGVLLGRSLALSGEVFLAMQSRGFRGEVYLSESPRFQWFDLAALAGFLGVALSTL